MPMGSGLGRARTPAKRTVVVVKRVESFMAENFLTEENISYD